MDRISTNFSSDWMISLLNSTSVDHLPPDQSSFCRPSLLQYTLGMLLPCHAELLPVALLFLMRICLDLCHESRKTILIDLAHLPCYPCPSRCLPFPCTKRRPKPAVPTLFRRAALPINAAQRREKKGQPTRKGKSQANRNQNRKRGPMRWIDVDALSKSRPRTSAFISAVLPACFHHHHHHQQQHHQHRILFPCSGHRSLHWTARMQAQATSNS